MRKFLKVALEILAIIVGADCESRRAAVNAGICDFSGQGRDIYGK